MEYDRALDHEEDFCETIQEVQLEVEERLRRGWACGEARHHLCHPMIIDRIRELTIDERLPEAMATVMEGGEFSAVDHAAATLFSMPVCEGLWNKTMTLEFGKDADHPDFVLAFLTGLAFPGHFDLIFGDAAGEDQLASQ